MEMVLCHFDPRVFFTLQQRPLLRASVQSRAGRLAQKHNSRRVHSQFSEEPHRSERESFSAICQHLLHFAENGGGGVCGRWVL